MAENEELGPVQIRRAVPADAAQIAAVLETIAAERIHSAIDQAWTVEEEQRYLESLSAREGFNVAVDGAIGVVAFQSLDLWSPLGSMAHVGQIGTFVLPAWRGQGVGRRLWRATEAMARAAGFRKLIAQVRGSNHAAQVFYSHLGFRECGRLTGQVTIDDVEDDVVLMEFFF